MLEALLAMASLMRACSSHQGVFVFGFRDILVALRAVLISSLRGINVRRHWCFDHGQLVGECRCIWPSERAAW